MDRTDKVAGPGRILATVYLLMALWMLLLLPGCALTGQEHGGQEDGGTKTREGTLDGASAAGTALPETAVPAAEEAGQGASGEGSERKEGVQDVLASLDFTRGSISLEETLERLDGKRISYEGYYNVSGERLDLTLEDGTPLVFLQVRDEAGYPLDRYELMMKGTEFNGNGFQEDYLCCFDVIRDEPYYPDLSGGIVEEWELWSLNQTDLAIVRNQIYAVHGRRFTDPFLDAVFREKNWYQPQYDGAAFDAVRQDVLSGTEQSNLSKLLEVEEMMHYRNAQDGDYRTARALLSGSWLDLDGDGRKERIECAKETEDGESGAVTLRIFGEEADPAQMRVEGVNQHEDCYVVSMDGTHWMMAVAADGFSGDYTCDLYGYEGGEIVERGRICSYAEGLKAWPDRISAPVEWQHFQCQPIERDYVLEGGRLVEVEREYYAYAGNTAVAKVRIPLLEEKARHEGGPVLEPGDRVIVCGGDLSEWVLLEKEATGERGWLNVVECGCRLPDGTAGYSWDWFEGLPFYG